MNRFTQFIFVLGAFFSGVVLSMHCSYCSRQNAGLPDFSPQQAEPVVVTRVCTVKMPAPRPVITSSRVEHRKFPIAPIDSSGLKKQIACSDSVTVLTQVESSVYEGDAYRAWVSGIEASLDSIVLFNRCDSVFVPVIPRCRPTRKKWHIGPYVGFGWTPEGLRPSVGVCVSFSIFDL